MKPLRPTCMHVISAVMALAAVASFANCANAQDRYAGKFTLSTAAQWGYVTLLPGEYTFSVKSGTGLLTKIATPDGKNAGIAFPVTNEPIHIEGQNCLILMHAAGKAYVREIRLPSAGIILVYSHPVNRAAREEQAERIEVTPISQQSANGK